MCTDVIVIVLFTAAAELSQGLLSDHHSLSAATLALRFSVTAARHRTRHRTRGLAPVARRERRTPAQSLLLNC